MSVEHATLLEIKARQAARAWSRELRVIVTPDLIALGALLVGLHFGVGEDMALGDDSPVGP